MNCVQKLWINIQLLFKDYASVKLFRLNEIGIPKYKMASQGMDIFNDWLLFQGSDNENAKGSVCMIDLKSKRIHNEFCITESCHMNNLNYAAPYLFISECKKPHRCIVLAINYSMTFPIYIQKISYKGSHYGNCANAFDWFVDGKYIYTFGMKGANEIEVLKFNMSDFQEKEYTFTDKDIISSFVLEDCHVYQGTKVINGKLYALFGLDTEMYPTYLKIINLETGKIERNINIKGLGELEAIAPYKNGFIVVNNAYNPTYRYLQLKL